MMEHTEQDISNINFANERLDSFLKNEEGFKSLLFNSAPYRYCILLAYQTLSKLNELPQLFGIYNSEFYKETLILIDGWYPEVEIEKNKKIELVKCMMVINCLAERRLSKTTGV